MLVTSKLKMDLVNPNPSLSVNAVQGDAYSRILSITFYNGVTPWPIPEGITVAVRYEKPDRTKGYYDTLPDGSSAWSVQENVLTVRLAPQMLTVPGTVNAQIELIQGTHILSTFGLALHVERNPAAGVLKSEDYINWLQWIKEESEEHVSQIQRSAQDSAIYADNARAAADLSADSASAAATCQKETAAIAANVSAIVAGNEAYTKQESDNQYSPSIIQETIGKSITITDSARAPFQRLILFGKTTQNGTPTPDAPVSLESIGKSVSVMVCGKNMLDVSQFTNGSQLTITNGAITITTSNDSIAVNTGKKLAELAPSLEVGKNYILTFKTTGTTNMILLYNANTYWDSNSALSITQEHLDSTVFLYASGKSTTATITDMMIRFVSASDARYEPYKEIQNLTVSVPNHLCGIPVTSGGNYTDENGQQWVCDEVDFEKGVYVQRVGSRTLNGSEDWSTGTCATSGMSRYVIISEKTTNKKILKNCSHFQSVYGSAYSATKDGLYYGYELFIFDFAISTEKATDMSSWKNLLNRNPVEVHWQLTEPIETALTIEQLATYVALHTNYPNTSVFNDGGAGMEVKYVADTKLYIDKKFADLATALVNT